MSQQRLLASGIASSLAARKPNNRQDDRGARDQREGSTAATTEIEKTDKRTIPRTTASPSERAETARLEMVTVATVTSVASKSPKATSHAASTLNKRPPSIPPLPLPPTDGGGGGGGGRNREGGGGNNAGGGGGGDGGGNDAGNAGSGFFDRPLATKARRRSNDFDNADRDEDDGASSSTSTLRESRSMKPTRWLSLQVLTVSRSRRTTSATSPSPRRPRNRCLGSSCPSANLDSHSGKTSHSALNQQLFAHRRENQPIPEIAGPRQPTATAGTIRWISRVERVATGDSSTRLDLSPDELLSTTRSVRRRLDLTRPVDPTLIEQCLDLAQQAPSGGNQQGWSFVVVTDPDKRQALGTLYKQGWDAYLQTIQSRVASEAMAATPSGICCARIARRNTLPITWVRSPCW